jgi:hypothetical protein
VIILRAGVARIDFYFTETCVSICLVGGPEGPKHIRTAINGALLTPIHLYFNAFLFTTLKLSFYITTTTLEGN